jgi:predicted component of type VI protein secretion system
LTLPSLVAIAALIVAATAIVRARRTARRLERLTESYWELRYEVAQVRARVARLEPPPTAESAQAESAATDSTTTFVSLSSLKRS